MIIGSPGCSLRSHSMSARPPIFGILRSVRTRSKACFDTRASASSPFAAVTHSCPSFASALLTMSRKVFSSSTTRMLLCLLMISRLSFEPALTALSLPHQLPRLVALEVAFDAGGALQHVIDSSAGVPRCSGGPADE